MINYLKKSDYSSKMCCLSLRFGKTFWSVLEQIAQSQSLLWGRCCIGSRNSPGEEQENWLEVIHRFLLSLYSILYFHSCLSGTAGSWSPCCCVLKEICSRDVGQRWQGSDEKGREWQREGCIHRNMKNAWFRGRGGERRDVVWKCYSYKTLEQNGRPAAAFI